MNPHIFRQYDIRGVADEDLTDDVVLAIGRAVGTHFTARGARRVAIGHDVRLSSPRITSALLKGLTRSGMDVLSVGEVPTPVLYHATAARELDGGIMVTGSHNPIEYNGIKMVRQGEAVYGDEIQTLGRIAESGDFTGGEGSSTSTDEAIAAYRSEVTPKLRPDRGLSIVIDCGNGAGSLLAVDLFRDLGHDVEPLYCEADGLFPNHLPDPTVPELMADLAEHVTSSGADLGIGFDGDADRLGAVDAAGRIVYGDQLLAFLARDLLERHPGSRVLFDVKCSQALVDDITAHGGVPIMGATGHSLIKARMKAEEIPLAGEMSGHMFLAEGYRGYDDAFFAAGRLLQAISRWGRSLGGLVDSLPAFHSSPEIRVDCPDDRKFEVVDALVERFAESHDVVTVDGVRVNFGDGWGLVRASNTQPVLVLRFEAKTPGRLEEIRAFFVEALSPFPEVTIP